MSDGRNFKDGSFHFVQGFDDQEAAFIAFACLEKANANVA